MFFDFALLWQIKTKKPAIHTNYRLQRTELTKNLTYKK